MGNPTDKIPVFKYPGICIMVMAALVITACSGSSSGTSGSTSVSALSLPDRIELTNVEGQSAASVPSHASGIVLEAFDDAGSDYNLAVKHSWVDDTDALDMVNDILGVVKDAGYANFVNQGAYKALVRQVGESQQSQSGGSTTSTATEQLMEIYVEVTRASNTAPMIVKVWVEEEEGPGEGPMLIRGYFTVTQGVSATYPYGVMTAHFKGTALDSEGNEGAEMFTMAMSVGADGGNVVIENVEDSEEGGGFEFHRRVRVVANADVTEGNAYVYVAESDWDNPGVLNETTQQVAFNGNYFKATEEGEDPVYFDKDDLHHRVFRYELFDAATGDSVTRNSGFPFETADGKHGYVGYYGLWAPYGTTVAHGDTVYDMDDNAYTVFQSAGKLTKHTRASMELGDLNNVELSKWGDGGDIIVTWNGSSFIKVGYRNQENGQIVYYTSGDPEYHATVTFQQWEGAWCEALKAFLRLGNVCFNPDSSPRTPSDSDTVYYHAETTLDPSEAADMTLYTWEFTMDMPIDQTGVSNYNNDMNSYWQTTPTEKTFYFDADTMMLRDGDGNPVTLGSLTIPDGSNLQWGYHIGPLTTTSYTIDDQWQAHESETYYTWNTGADEWNQYVTLIDANSDFVSFDAPISFAYTHSMANDVNGDGSYDGKKFRLEYDGFSVNIPWEFDDQSDEWQPLINIKDGTIMGPTGNEYVIKGLEESLIMTAVDGTGITFDNETDVGAPSLTYDATKTALVDDIPASALLKVIKGELIE
jgi:hypothetical protein